jgi:hypothetical protein
VPAARLADVGARDAQPLVLGGGLEHLPQELPVSALQLRPLAQLEPRGRDPGREGVAHPLELL